MRASTPVGGGLMASGALGGWLGLFGKGSLGGLVRRPRDPSGSLKLLEVGLAQRQAPRSAHVGGSGIPVRVPRPIDISDPCGRVRARGGASNLPEFAPLRHGLDSFRLTMRVD